MSFSFKPDSFVKTLIFGFVEEYNKNQSFSWNIQLILSLSFVPAIKKCNMPKDLKILLCEKKHLKMLCAFLFGLKKK
jgi:hypothetical protein